MRKMICIGKSLWDFSVSGEVIIFKDDEFPSVEECHGKIIVTNIPSPDIVMYMSECLAIVAETGGLLCHAAVLALEMGCPIIVSADGVTNKLRHGQRVLVSCDNHEGYIYEEVL